MGNLLFWEVVPIELKPSFIAKQWVWGLLLHHAPHESTGLQNAVFLHDLYHRVCEPQLTYNGCKWSSSVAFWADYVDMLICFASQADKFVGGLQSHSSYVLFFLQLTCVFQMFSSCLEWNLLLNTFSAICTSKYLSCLELAHQVKVKVKFTLEQARKAQRRRRGIALLLL